MAPKRSGKTAGRYVQPTLDGYIRILSPPRETDSTLRDGIAEFVQVNETIGELETSQWSKGKCACVGECGTRCSNRRRRIECDVMTCNLGPACGNRR